jgi:mycothiol synthase
MIKVRPYRAADLSAALEVINAAAQVDHTRRITEAVFRRAWAGPAYYDHAAVAVAEAGRLAGFIWWDRDQSQSRRLEGWVHPAYRRRGVGTALLIAAECAARAQEALPITLTGRVYSDIPGGEALFRQRGYTEVHRFYLMSLSLVGRRFVPIGAVPPGVTLRTFQEYDLAALVEADNAIFAGTWGARARTAQTWQREMQETRPYDPSLWLLAWENDRVVGECLCHQSREAGPTDAWISILGVREDWRGRGLGRTLLVQGLQLLQQAGFTSASLHVDAENAPALSLYRSVDMGVARTRVHFARQIEPTAAMRAR